MTPEQIDDGLWRWTARHPQWHPRGFGDEVGCYALREGGDTVLVDPLLPPGEDGLLDDVVAGAVTVMITIPYHARSAAALARRYDAQVLGHAATAKRLPAGARFRAIAPGDELPHGIEAFAVGSPRRQEQPLWFASRRALAFGDAVVEAEGALRVWIQQPVDDRRERWHRTRLVPTLEPLADLGAEQVLVTHGRPVLRGGGRALRAALDGPPWYHRSD